MIAELLTSALQLGLGANALFNSRAFPRLVTHEKTFPNLDITVALPMRNEIKNCERLLHELLAARDYFHEIVILDDGSTDGTREVLERFAKTQPGFIRIIDGKAKPPEWKGKVWALDQLVTSSTARYLLFVDADVSLSREGIEQLISDFAIAPVDHFTLFPHQNTTPTTDILINHIFTTLLLFLPARLVSDPRYPAAIAGCGQVQIVDTIALRELGGYQTISGSLHDGLTLSRTMKRAVKRVRCAFSGDNIRCTMYESFSEAWQGFVRNAYEANGSIISLSIISLLLCAVFIAGPIFAFTSHTLWPISALCSIFFYAAYSVAMRRFGAARGWILRAPISIVVMTVLQYLSFMRHALGIKTNWKGREA